MDAAEWTCLAKNHAVGGLGLVLTCQTCVFDTSTAEGEADEESSGEDEDEDEEEEQSGGINIGKAFLLPRAKLSLYDQDIFARSLLEGRDKVSHQPATDSLPAIGSTHSFYGSASFVLRLLPCHSANLPLLLSKWQYLRYHRLRRSPTAATRLGT